MPLLLAGLGWGSRRQMTKARQALLGSLWSDAGEPTPRTALGAASRSASQPHPARAGGLDSRQPQAPGTRVPTRSAWPRASGSLGPPGASGCTALSADARLQWSQADARVSHARGFQQRAPAASRASAEGGACCHTCPRAPRWRCSSARTSAVVPGQWPVRPPPPRHSARPAAGRPPRSFCSLALVGLQ